MPETTRDTPLLFVWVIAAVVSTGLGFWIAIETVLSGFWGGLTFAVAEFVWTAFAVTYFVMLWRDGT